MRITALCACVVLTACADSVGPGETPVIGYPSFAGAQAPEPTVEPAAATQDDTANEAAATPTTDTQAAAAPEADAKPVEPPPPPTSSAQGFCEVPALNRIVGCDSNAAGEVDELNWIVTVTNVAGQTYDTGMSCRLTNVEPCPLDNGCTVTWTDDIGEVHTYRGRCVKLLDEVDTSKTVPFTQGF